MTDWAGEEWALPGLALVLLAVSMITVRQVRETAMAAP